MKYTIFLALALPAFSQVVSIDAGSPSDHGYTGGAVYGVAQQADLGRQVAPFNSLRFGSSFSYDIVVPAGVCNVGLQFYENRAAGPNPATQSAVGTRVFIVTTATTRTSVDIFASTGAQTPWTLSLPPVPTPDGHLRIGFLATHGNASVSGIQADCTPTPAPPLSYDAATGVWTFTGKLHITDWLETGAPGTPTVFTVTDSAGKQCQLTFDAGKVLLKC